MNDRHRIGLVSDTHGKIPDLLYTVLEGCELLIHAGDLAGAKKDVSDITVELQAIAPVLAVSGNCDGFESCGLPLWELARIGSYRVGVTHIAAGQRGTIVDEVHAEAKERQVGIVIYGHSHIPRAHKEGEILYVNPGSAGDPRYGHPPSAAILELDDHTATVRWFNLSSGAEFTPSSRP